MVPGSAVQAFRANVVLALGPCAKDEVVTRRAMASWPTKYALQRSDKFTDVPPPADVTIEEYIEWVRMALSGEGPAREACARLLVLFALRAYMRPEQSYDIKALLALLAVGTGSTLAEADISAVDARLRAFGLRCFPWGLLRGATSMVNDEGVEQGGAIPERHFHPESCHFCDAATRTECLSVCEVIGQITGSFSLTCQPDGTISMTPFTTVA